MEFRATKNSKNPFFSNIIICVCVQFYNIIHFALVIIFSVCKFFDWFAFFLIAVLLFIGI